MNEYVSRPEYGRRYYIEAVEAISRITANDDASKPEVIDQLTDLHKYIHEKLRDLGVRVNG